MKKTLAKNLPEPVLNTLRRIKRAVLPPPKPIEVLWHEVSGGPLKGKKLFLADDGSWKREMVEGTYEEDFYGHLERLALSGKTIFDIGAHIGYYSMVFAELAGAQGRVYAFEPNPLNYERLKKHVVENGFEKRITSLPCALSDKNGSEELVFEPRVEKASSTGGFLSRSDTAWEKSVYEERIGFRRQAVETRTLDSLRADSTLPKPDLMKIDIEGGEYLLLAGARKTLREDRPVLLIEVHSIFNMWHVGKELEGLYDLTLLSEEPDGRCFFEATPKRP